MKFESFGNKPLLDKGFECCFARQTSAFKISFTTSYGVHAPEEMLNRSSLTSTSNGFMKLWKAVSEDLSRYV